MKKSGTMETVVTIADIAGIDWNIGQMRMMQADVMSGLKRKAGGLYKYEKKQTKEAEKSVKDRAKEAKKAAKK